MEYKKIHLINDKGKKLVVERREFNISQQNDDGKYDGYYIDLDWYLANGYVIAEEGFKRIEGQLIDNGKDCEN